MLVLYGGRGFSKLSYYNVLADDSTTERDASTVVDNSYSLPKQHAETIMLFLRFRILLRLPTAGATHFQVLS